MTGIELALNLLSLMPAIQFGTPALQPAAAVGSGTVLVAACRPGMVVSVFPGNLSAAADGSGVAEIRAPAQLETSDPYRVSAGGAVFVLNGTLHANESVSAVCP